MLVVTCRFEAIFKRRTGRMFSSATEEDWKHKSDGIASFKTPHGTLQNEDILHEGYRPKMLLYALNKLFYIYDQVKNQQCIDERLVVAYEILGLAALHCTKWWHGSDKQGVPDALSLLNLNNARHLECLVWVVYDAALLVGRQPELPGDCQWCTVLVGTVKHIYRGCNDAAHCPPYTLASWDCQQKTKVLRRAATRMHPGPGEDPGAAPGTTPGC